MSAKIYLAVDATDLDAATALANKVHAQIDGLKLGLEFFCANGHAGVQAMAKIGLPLFLDLKLHDIPNTVAKAVRALAPMEPEILTIHAAGGRAMMEDAKAAAPTHTHVVGVTVLTSIDGEDLQSIGVASDPMAQVERLAQLSEESGLDGIVCSGHELKHAKKQWNGGYFVVPGLRPANASVGDQKRIVTPAQAAHDGASVLVIGRPISAAEDPVAAAQAIRASL